MSEIRSILVPVDLSDPSRTVVRSAAGLAKKLGASVHLLHVWRPDTTVPLETILAEVGTGPPATLAEIARREASADLGGLADLVRDLGVSKVTASVESGDPRRVIVGLAEKYDMVMMGTHGRTGIARAALGSVAENVVRRCPVPVLTVPIPKKQQD